MLGDPRCFEPRNEARMNDERHRGIRGWGLLPDVCVILAFVAIAFLCFVARWRGIDSFAFLSSDAANVASFAAARANPDLFANDAVLASTSATAFYLTFHTLWVGQVGAWLNDFALAYLLLLIPTVLLYLTFWYAFGRTLFGNAIGALCLALLMSGYAALPLGEYWGLSPDPLPRLLFAALLPLPLLLIVLWREQPRFWVIPMAILGLLTYVHPVSAPGVAGSVWLGLLAMTGRQWWQYKGSLLASALAFLAVMAPFALLYFGSTASRSDIDVATVYRIMAERFAPGFLDVPLAAELFVTRWLSLKAVLPIAAGASAWYLWMRSPDSRSLLRFLFGMFLGLTVFAFVVPYLDQVVMRSLDRLPKLIDFMRVSRYLVMVMLIIAVWGAVAWATTAPRRPWKLAACAAAAAVWLVAAKPDVLVSPYRLALCALRGNPLCGPSPEEANRIALLEAIKRETPKGARLVSLAGDVGLDIRYAALRPLAFTWKDGGALAYTDPSRLVAWAVPWRSYEAIREETDRDRRAERIGCFIQEIGADYAVLAPADAQRAEFQPAIVYANRGYALLDAKRLPMLATCTMVGAVQ